MPYNGSGTFTPYTPGNPVVTGTVISSTAFNATQNDLAAGLTNAITRDGQSPPSANLPMGGKKHTGLAAGVTSGDSLRWEQLFSQGIEQDIASAATTDIGSLNTTNVRITGTTTITSFGTNYNGPRYVRFAGALTLTHNATTLILPGGVNITTAAGDCLIAVPNGSSPNGWRVVLYQLAATVPLSLPLATTQGGSGSNYANVAALFNGIKQAATDTTTGVVELATDAEAQAGTSTSVVLTPANMKAAQIQLGASDTVSGKSIVNFSVPAYPKRFTFYLSGVSTTGTAGFGFQIGDSGGIETSGYSGGFTIAVTAGATQGGNPTTYAGVSASNGANSYYGEVVFNRVSGNLWSISGHLSLSNSGVTIQFQSLKTLSDTLTQAQFIVNSPDTGDAGTIYTSFE